MVHSGSHKHKRQKPGSNLTLSDTTQVTETLVSSVAGDSSIVRTAKAYGDPFFRADV